MKRRIQRISQQPPNEWFHEDQSPRSRRLLQPIRCGLAHPTKNGDEWIVSTRSNEISASAPSGTLRYNGRAMRNLLSEMRTLQQQTRTEQITAFQIRRIPNIFHSSDHISKVRKHQDAEKNREGKIETQSPSTFKIIVTGIDVVVTEGGYADTEVTRAVQPFPGIDFLLPLISILPDRRR